MLRAALAICLLAATPPAAHAQDDDAEPPWPEDEPGWVLAAEHARGIAPRQLRSAELGTARSELSADLRATRRAAPGRHADRGSSRALLGRTYAWSTYRLSVPPDELALEGMIARHLRADPADFVFYTDVTRLRHVTSLDVEKAFGLTEQPSVSESAERRALAEHITAIALAHPDLELYRARGGWADAVGAATWGVALVDPRSREVLWIFMDDVWGE